MSAVLRVTLAPDGSCSGRPDRALRLVGPGRRDSTRSGAAPGTVRSLSQNDFGARAVRIAGNGTLEQPA